MAEEQEDNIDVDLSIFLNDDYGVRAIVAVPVVIDGVPIEIEGEPIAACITLKGDQLLHLIAALISIHDMIKGLEATAPEERKSLMEAYLVKIQARYN